MLGFWIADRKGPFWRRRLEVARPAALEEPPVATAIAPE
jgi:hypothetical protein